MNLIKRIIIIAGIAVSIIMLSACGTESLQKTGKQKSDSEIFFPAYNQENLEDLPYIDEVNNTPKFKVTADFPQSWIFENKNRDNKINVPGEFYTPIYIYENDKPIGYIGFNKFEPYEDEIEKSEYYKTVYPALRLSSLFKWDPYVSVISDDNEESGIADIWYIDPSEAIDSDGNMAEKAQFETKGVLIYNKKLKLYIGVAFMPGAVSDEQIEKIAKSIALTQTEQVS